MALALVGTPTTAMTGAASATIAKPTGAAVGDVICCIVAGYNAAATISGFTSFYTWSDTHDSNAKFAVLYRIVTGTEGSSFSISATGSAETGGIMWCCSGADTTTPLENAALGTETDSGQNQTFASVSVTRDGSWWIKWSANFNNGGDVGTAPTGTELGFAQDAGNASAVAYYESVSAGSTGTDTLAWDTDPDTWYPLSVILRPASSSGAALSSLGGSSDTGHASLTGAGALSALGAASSSGVAAITGPVPGAISALGVSMTANAEQPATPIIQQIVAPGVSMSAAQVQALAVAAIAALAMSATRASVTLRGGGAISACGVSQSAGRAAPSAVGMLEALGLAGTSGRAQPAGAAQISASGISATAATAEVLGLGTGAISARGISWTGAMSSLTGAGSLSLLGTCASDCRVMPGGVFPLSARGVSAASGAGRLSGVGSFLASGASASTGLTQAYGAASISALGMSMSEATLSLLAVAPGTLTAVGLCATAAMVGGYAGVPVQAGKIPFYITVNQSTVSITQNQSAMEIVP